MQSLSHATFAREVDLQRISVTSNLNPKRQVALGQYLTPVGICDFMASLFNKQTSVVRLLDPGAGIGSLTSSFVSHVLENWSLDQIDVTCIEIDADMSGVLASTIATLAEMSTTLGVKSQFRIIEEDYIEVSSFSPDRKKYTHAILNPPYQKIPGGSPHAQQLASIGIQASNLYTAFMALSADQLVPGGEMVAIIPRSFCNGPYFKKFRQRFFKEMSITDIHLFQSRSCAFKGDAVLQENIIVRFEKSEIPEFVKVTSSQGADFIRQEDGRVYSPTSTTYNAPYCSVLGADDEDFIVHIPTNAIEHKIVEYAGLFPNTLSENGLGVSTGPVVDFRLKPDLVMERKAGAAPLLYAQHLRGRELKWPVEGKKANCIEVSAASRPYLWPSQGHYVVTKRFSSKEETKRIVATVVSAPSHHDLIGFENHLNVIHKDKSGLSEIVANGLAIFLNSTLIDRYFRIFNGHTQVNSGDLRMLKYPSFGVLERIGRKHKSNSLSQTEIDAIIEREIQTMTDKPSPVAAVTRIEEAMQILSQIGMPREQLNERSALTLLAIGTILPNTKWVDTQTPLIGITPIMEFCAEVYGKEYKPNTRETFRRQTMHQFVDAGFALANPDQPDRAVNSPKFCYQLTPEAVALLMTFGTPKWEASIASYTKVKGSLKKRYAKKRDMVMLPVKTHDGMELVLTPGDHSELIRQIIQDFAPRFAPGCELLYVGDTGQKTTFFNAERFKELGVEVIKGSKLPDVVLYLKSKDWLLLIESVTSHGPVDSKRHEDLAELFKGAKPGLVYVTAFPSRKLMAKFLTAVSWETEVWVADSPTHLIHFNGDRFLGPH